MQPIKTAIVGFGISGQCFQAPILKDCPEIDLCAVVSSNTEKVHAQLPSVKVYSSIEAMLENPSIELVIIATPNHLHVPQAKLALLAGKHVVIEKPFSINVKEGKELIEVAKQVDKLLSVYQSRRFDGDFKTIKKLINEEKLNNIHTFYSSYNRYKPEVKVRWREQNVPGSGIVYDLGAHLIDQTLCLFGLPQAVTAQLKAQRPEAEAIDHFHIVLHYPERDAILHSNCLSVTEGPRFQIFTHDAAFIKYGMDTQEDLLREKQGPNSIGWGEDKPENYAVYTNHEGEESVIETEKGGYEVFYQQVANAIRNGSSLPVTAEQALDIIRIIEAAYESSSQRRTIDL
ncbi:dehydrogenase [Vibrio ishigakensis]|uniref:Dehydrogenase n=1 Tax=Vibrio ishigakensis TaxID=1481914 RepID=A0A0B8PEW8_9VIBR|nr:dehydrogenase [Vibrio ishigakensis]